MARDALYNDVALLLHCNGTNGSTTFTDNGPTAKVVTATNGAQISTAQSKWGGASGLFDGTNDYLTVGTAPEWRFLHDDTTDFSIEGWVYWNGGASDLTIISTAAASANVGFYLQVLGSDSRKLNVQIYRGVGGNHLSATSSTGISSGAWTYFKFRYTKTTRAYAFRIGSSDAGSGTLAVTGTWPSSSTSDPTYTLAIGRYQYSTPGGYLNGYLDDLRITAAARTETSEPSAAFPDSAPVHKAIDRCKETTSTGGTGNLTLAGPVSGYVGVMDATYGLADDLDTSWFCAEAGTQWEVFLGTRVSATELARTTLLSSSTGSTINFSTPPAVFSTVPAMAFSGPAFKADRITSDQSVTSGVWTKVQLNGVTFDTHACFDSATNYRFTPNVAGYYQISFTLDTGATSAGTTALSRVNKNGSPYLYGAYVTMPGSVEGISSGAGLVYMNGTTDYIELYGLAVGTAVKFKFSAATYMTGCFIRP